MRKLFNCRRSILAVIGIASLTFLGIYHGVDISGIAVAIAGIVGTVAASNAYQNKGQ